MADSDRFAASKELTHRKAEISNTVASIVRQFKAGQIVNEADLDYVIGHAEAMRDTVKIQNDKRKRELGKVVKTP